MNILFIRFRLFRNLNRLELGYEYITLNQNLIIFNKITMQIKAVQITTGFGRQNSGGLKLCLHFLGKTFQQFFYPSPVTET